MTMVLEKHRDFNTSARQSYLYLFGQRCYGPTELVLGLSPAAESILVSVARKKISKNNASDYIQYQN